MIDYRSDLIHPDPDPLVHTDPFTLRANLGGGGDGKKYKYATALRGIPEAAEKYHQTLILPFPPGHIATFYIGDSVKPKSLDFWVVRDAEFWIIAANPDAEHRLLGQCHYLKNETMDPFWGHHIAGYFDILAYGKGKTQALRLLKWWLEWEPTIPRRRAMAEHLGRMIGIRGQKEPGSMFQPGPHDIEIDGPAFNPADWDIVID